MSSKLSNIIIAVLIAISVIVGIVLYAQLPGPMPSHWNAAGQVDGYMSKFWGVFLMPIITVGVLALFMVIPAIDPLKANIAQFRGLYNTFMVGFTAYMLYIYALTMFAALGYQFNMTVMIMPAVGLLFIGLGYMMRKAKRNFFIGIRTPWTLSSDYVWEETHKLGSILFMIAGVLTVISGFLGENGVFLLMGAILLAAFVPIIYSYILWQKVSKS
jgi:uncharacterized membrane protein